MLQLRYYYSHFIVEEIKSLSSSVGKEKKKSDLSQWASALSSLSSQLFPGVRCIWTVRKKEDKTLINAIKCVNL